MLNKWLCGAALVIALAACNSSTQAQPNEASAASSPAGSQSTDLLTKPATGSTSIARLDCGSILVKDFSKSFSDRQIYPHGPKRMTDSCYLITHEGQRLLWDTGLPPGIQNEPGDDEMVPSLKATVAEQLGQLGLKPTDIVFVGISHMHFDHAGQANQFPAARLIVGKGDFEKAAGKDDPFGPWRGEGKQVTLATGDVDVFGDGSVIALHMPGHTPDHLALLVKLKSGPVLLSGDLYHATEARAQRGVPPFNTDRAQTLASMDRFEHIAKQLHAKVIIQHEPGDIGKLPAFPKMAQ